MFRNQTTIKGTERPRGSEGYSLFFVVILLSCMHIGLFWQNSEAITNRILLIDGDGYWHLLRVEKLYETQEWYDLSLSRSNAPYGEKLHWTKAFDLMLFGGAVIASPLIPFKEALYWWGTIINPVFHLLTLLTLVWSARFLIEREYTSLVGFLLLFQLFTTAHFSVGRPDHHGFMLCLFVFLLGAVFRILTGEHNRAWCFVCGTIAAVAVWAGIESLVAVFVLLIFLGLAWVCYGDNFGPQNLFISIVLFFVSFLCLIVDVPVSEFFTIEFDRLSIVHIALWGFIAAFWGSVIFLEHNSKLMDRPKKRLIIALGGAIACITIMYTIFPKFFYGPTVDIHPELKSVYMNQTSEFTPLFSKLDRFPNSVMLAWGLAFLTLPISLVYLTHSIGQKRFAWAFTALLIFVYLILALCQKRWLSYAQLLSVIPLAQLWSTILQWQKLYIRGGIRPMIRSLTLVLFCLVPFVLIFSTADQREPSLLGQEEFSHKLCLYLNDKQLFGESPMRILTSIFIGPLILYQTEHEVIGTPAHRNERGILDTVAIMNAVNNETAHQIIEKRGINAILIGRPDRGLYDYLIPEAKIKGKFYHRLWYGPVPDWLEFQPVPMEFDQKIKFFKVRHPVIIDGLVKSKN